MHSSGTEVLNRFIAAACISLFACFSAWAQSDLKPPMWEIRSGDAAVYLFGTIHVGAEDFYPLPERVESAFRNSDILALEIDPGNTQDAAAAVAIAMYAPPDHVGNHLPPDLLKRVRKVTAKFGLSFQQLQQMKPYLLMFSLTTLEYARLGYEAAFGLDAHFSRQAHENGKQILALESMNQQMNMLDALSPKLQTAMLQITLDEIEKGEVPDLVDEMMRAWRSGNIKRLGEVLSVEERKLPRSLQREFHRHFLAERNVAMSNQIVRMLKNEQRVFVAVGALHMVGKDGIPALLSKRGYKVKRR